MKTNRLFNNFIVSILALISIGCTGETTTSSNPNVTQVVANQDPRKQLLDAQFDSILSMRQQMTDFYNRMPGSISSWGSNEQNHYYDMQNQLNSLYTERQQLINQLGGTTVGQYSNQPQVQPLGSNQPSTP
jgi:hypothetical protein